MDPSVSSDEEVISEHEEKNKALGSLAKLREAIESHHIRQNPDCSEFLYAYNLARLCYMILHLPAGTEIRRTLNGDWMVKVPGGRAEIHKLLIDGVTRVMRFTKMPRSPKHR